MNCWRSWLTSNLDQENSLILPCSLTLESQHSMPTEMVIQDLSQQMTSWRLTTSLLTLEATSLSTVRFIRELWWEDQSRWKVQLQDRQERDQLKLLDNQFLQEYQDRERLHKLKRPQQESRRSIPKHSRKLTQERSPFCHQNIRRRTCRQSQRRTMSTLSIDRLPRHLPSKQASPASADKQASWKLLRVPR